ncbi:MAG: hypothetical protein J7M08_08570 [Planctomycetes bacterium]|nr:hypothetical protein [Planctomycetota bacterium]
MTNREEIEKVLADVKRQREEAEAEAGHAARSLARLVSGITPLAELDGAEAQAAAETLVQGIERLRMLQQFARTLRGLLI